MPRPDMAVHDRQWFIVARWQRFAGEGSANLLRVVAVTTFYLLQLVVYYRLTPEGERDPTFQRAATLVAAAAAFSALTVLLCLQRRVFPSALSYLSTLSDLLLVTALASFGSGPHSPVVLIYFLVLALAGLRFDRWLVSFAVVGSIAGYMGLVGSVDDSWFDADHAVAPVRQLMMIASLALTGMVIGQQVHQSRALAEEFAKRLTARSAEGDAK